MIYNIDDLIKRLPSLAVCRENIENSGRLLTNQFSKGNKLLICGNGGSAADSEHISGELLKGFLSKRPLSREKIDEYNKNCPEFGDNDAKNLQEGLPAIPLTSLSALSTAFSNDVNPDYVFAQGVMALGSPGDVLIGISTSGNSQNVLNAAKTAKAKGLYVIGLTGADGGKLKELSDYTIKVPEKETFMVQELHIGVYHYLCAYCENEIFGRSDS